MVSPQICPKCGKQMMEIADDGCRIVCMSCGYDGEIRQKKVIVAVAGHFDPPHPGHYRHLLAASKLGDSLMVFVSNDADAIRKKGKCNIPLKDRCWMMQVACKGLGIDAVVIPTCDADGTQAITLGVMKPDIFAKGGDRDCDANMPFNELEACKKHGIEIRYGIGKQEYSSSKIVIENGTI